MKKQGRALLLVGSAQRPRSTSESLGTYLCQRLQARGFQTETQLLHRVFRGAEAQAALLEAVTGADLLVLAFPLYVDALPALVVRTLETIAAQAPSGPGRSAQRLVAIANCGFPEAGHNNVALAICRQFAVQTGFQWAGSLSLGGGQAINGRPLAEVGGMARDITAALDRAADALAVGDPIPELAHRLMARQPIPSRVYIWMGGWGWRLQARKNGAQRRLYARPYAGR